MITARKFINGYFHGEYRAVFWLTNLFAGYILSFFLVFYWGEVLTHPWIIPMVIVVGAYVPLDDWLFREQKISRSLLFYIKCIMYLPIIFTMIFLSGGYESPIIPAVYLTIMTIPLYGNNKQSIFGITLTSLCFSWIYLSDPSHTVLSWSSYQGFFGFFVYIVSFYAISGAIRSFVSKLQKKNAEIKVVEAELSEKNQLLTGEIAENIAKLEKQNINLDKANKAMIGRELKMIELKKKISEFEKAHGGKK